MDHAENNQGNISSRCYITRYTGTMFVTAEENLSYVIAIGQTPTSSLALLQYA